MVIWAKKPEAERKVFSNTQMGNYHYLIQSNAPALILGL